MRVDKINDVPYVTLYDQEKYPEKIASNLQIVIVSESGHGKTLLEERFMQEYRKLGYIIIVLTEKPDSPFEMCFSMFPASAKYHLKYLQNQGDKPEGVPIKIYHPAVLSSELKHNLPPINFFTIPLKSLTNQELAVLLQATTKHDSITLMDTAIQKLGRDDGLLDLIFQANKSIRLETQKLADGTAIPKFNEEFGVPAPESGTSKNISHIISAFGPFLRNYMLVSEKQDQHELNWKDILSDNKHYHIFSTAFIPPTHKRIRYFVVNWLLNQIKARSDTKKHPILIVVQEAKVFMPDNTEEVYVKRTAENFGEALSIMRSMNISSVADSQGYYELNGNYRDNTNETFFGSLSPTDLERLGKALRLPGQIKSKLVKMTKGHFYRKGNYRELAMLFPTHAHKEEGQEFLKEHHKAHPETERSYQDVLDYLTEVKNQQFQRRDKRMSEFIKKRMAEAETRAREEQAKLQTKGAEIAQTQAVKADKVDLDRAKKLLVYHQSKLNPSLTNPPSWKNLAKTHGLNDKTIKSYATAGQQYSQEPRSSGTQAIAAPQYTSTDIPTVPSADPTVDMPDPTFDSPDEENNSYPEDEELNLPENPLNLRAKKPTPFYKNPGKK